MSGKILGISAFYHDSAAAIVVDGEIVGAAQEERFTREKHTEDFPLHAVQYCLEEAGLQIDDLDAVVFYDKPLLKFERLLETYYAHSPRGLSSFLKSIPVWLDQKLFLKRKLHQGLREVMDYNRSDLQLLFPEHHLSHAASAFYPSGFEEAAILTIDGVGEYCTASIGKGRGKNIEIIREMHFPHSIGLLYSAFTYYLGFKVNSGEYKLMGLAPYGERTSEETKRYMEKIKGELIEVFPDGSIQMNMAYFEFSTGLRMCNDQAWKRLFGLEKRQPEDPVIKSHCNLAIAIQMVTEEVTLLMAKEAIRLTGSRNLCMAGGVALNCVSNGKLIQSGILDHLFVQPAAGDAGGALGAALAAYHIYFDQERLPVSDQEYMKGAYLGPYFSLKEVSQMTKKFNAVGHRFEERNEQYLKVATQLEKGRSVGWFQGRMEYGPRALGNRSILADPRSPEMQKHLNLQIKFRESFRPFAPSIKQEALKKYFDLPCDSPYMLLVAQILEEWCLPIPEDYQSWGFKEQLNFKKSELPAITHVDFSSRVQTVNKKTNEAFWRLLDAFEGLTSCPVLVNTSFNVRGEPIVCTPEDAYRCFMATGLDILVINDWVYIKEEQEDWEDREKWGRNFKPD